MTPAVYGLFVVDSCRLLQLVVDDFGWLLVVVDRCGQYWTALECFG